MVQLVEIYVFVLAITTVLALGVAFLAWRQRATSNAWPVVVLMFGVAIWCGTEAVMWFSPTLAQQAFWLKLTYVGVSVVVGAFLIFAFDIAGLEKWRTPRVVFLVSVPLVVICILAITDPGGLFYAGFVPHKIGSYIHYAALNGPLFWVNITVAYGTLLFGLGLIIRAHFQSTPAERTQTRIVLVAALVPFAASFMNQLSSTQVEGIESTAFFFTGLAFLFALIRGQLLHPSGRLVTAQDLLDGQVRERRLQTTNRELGDELKATRHRADRLYDQATHDPLTNLANRRSLQDDLIREVARAQRTGEPIAFLMFDLDDFKEVNDTYSHLAGDAALKMVAEVIMRCSRQLDIMCRWGGDEFLVVMPSADVDTACRRAEELREEIDTTKIRYDHTEFSITTTIGVAVYPEHAANANLTILAADQALLVAKREGGNRIAIADPSGPRLAAGTAERN